MSLYTVKVAVKYEQIVRVEADSRDQAEELAMDKAAAEAAKGVEWFGGAPYVTDLREPRS